MIGIEGSMARDFDLASYSEAGSSRRQKELWKVQDIFNG